jgi:hypothetical protein
MLATVQEMAVFGEVGQAGIEREENGDGNEDVSADEPSGVEPSGFCKFAHAQNEQEENDGYHLPGRLVFSEFISGQHDVFRGSESAKTGDEKFAADD